MAQQRVVTVDDITRIDFSPHRLPGCERGLLHDQRIGVAAHWARIGVRLS